MPTGSDIALIADAVSAGYGPISVLHQVSLRLDPATMTAVVGPNGAGKTTLLRVLAGTLKPGSGRVCVDGLDLDKLSRRETAQRVAVVPQRLEVGFGLRAEEVVWLGRTPYLSVLGGSDAAGRSAVERAMQDTETLDLAARRFDELSGGEAQRVVLAMALAQEARYLLLDEPTVHLDLGQRWKLVEHLTRLCRERNVGILAIVHDLDLAAAAFDRAVMMASGRIVADGPPASVLSPANVRACFGLPDAFAVAIAAGSSPASVGG